MYLATCLNCRHGSVRDGWSHCSKEAVYSAYSRCIQRIALEDYLQRSGRVTLIPGLSAGNGNALAGGRQ